MKLKLNLTNNIAKYSLVLCFLLFSLSVNSQNQIIIGEVIHIGNGEVIKNGYIEFAGEKIIKIGSAKDLKDTTGKKVYYYPAYHIYPGLISLYTSIGLNEIDAVRATRDNEEIGTYNPNVRTSVSYNTDSDIIPTTRSNGILLAQITPHGDVIAGSSSVMALDGWTWEEALYKADEGIHLNWPSYYSYNAADADKHKEERKKTIQGIEKFFTDATAYAMDSKPETKNIRFEAIKGLMNGNKTLYINAWYAKEIIEAVNFVKSFGVKKIAIIGAGDSKNILAFLKENDISVILYRLHSLPIKSEDDVASMFKLPKLFKEAGVKFALSYYGDMEEMGNRNLPFVAGTAATYGLSKEDALRSVTLSSAEILGIDKTTGSLETGKEASIVISKGDLLDMKSSEVVSAFLKGKELNLDNKQKQLFSKYTQKYGLK